MPTSEEDLQETDTRMFDAERIKQAYENVDIGLGEVGRLLRTTQAGQYMWSAEHKTIVMGMRAMIRKLQHSVPSYDGER